MATMLLAIAGPALAQQSQLPVTTGPQAPAQGQRPSPFERADSNSDGVITREEVRVARTGAFARLDANRDGFLVREEMPRIFSEGRSDGQPIGRRSASKSKDGRVVSRDRINLTDADANRDGTITRTEFDAAYVQEQSAYAADRAAASTSMFIFLDTDKNGSISRDEVIASNGRRQTFQRIRPEGPAPISTGSTGTAQKRSIARRHPMLNSDTNSDQKVSLTEWLARPNPLFDRGDTNNDGRVTREEAAAFTRQAREQRPSAKRPW